MRDWQWLLPLLALVGCKRHPTPAPSEAGPPVVVKEPVTPVVTIAPDKLEVIATSKGLFEPRLKVLGGHVWVASYADDGLADGDGPLARIRSPLEGLKFGADGARHAGIDVVGTYPRLFALFALHGISRTTRPAATWVRSADGAWKETASPGLSFYPKLFTAFGDGALIVDSAADRNSLSGFSSGLSKQKNTGTWAKRIGPDGSVTDASLLLAPDFVAWHGVAEGETLALVGTTKSDGGALRGIDVVRIVSPTEALHHPLTDAEQNNRGALDARLQFHDGKTLVIPPAAFGREEVSWAPGVRTFHFVERNGASSQVEMPAPTVDAGPGDCRVVDADFRGDDIYVLRTCDPYLRRRANDLLRLHRNGSAEQFELPAYNGGPCAPKTFALRGSDDLWVTARCGPDLEHGIDVVLRRGHAQKLLEMQ